MKLSKTKSKNRSNFFEKCLILHWLFKIKGQKSCLEQRQKHFLLNNSWRTKVNFVSALSSLFILRLTSCLFWVLSQITQFLGNYWWILNLVKIWWDNFMQSDKSKRLTFYHMLGILLLYSNFHRWSCQAIHTNHWEVECCTVILILSSNKTIRTLT